MKWRPFLIGVAIGAFASLAACVGINDTDADRAVYCHNVKAGIWPDFRETYREECGGKNPPKFNADLTK